MSLIALALAFLLAAACSSGPLTVAIAPSLLVPSLEALDTWNAALARECAIEFRLADRETADIEILEGDARGSLGYTYDWRIEIAPDRQEAWVLPETIAHELGHALGLLDNTDPTSLMNGAPAVPHGPRPSRRDAREACGKSGAVVDVEHILGEKSEASVSEQEDGP